LTGGNNIGRIGTLQHVEKAPGSYSIAHVVDSRGQSFSTRLENVFVIGTSKKAVISLPKGEGMKYSLIEEREHRVARTTVEEADEDSDE
jgi:small subunit ribosomal protein S4e